MAVNIPMRARGGAIKAIAVVDDTDAWVAQWRWSQMSNGYAYRRVGDESPRRTIFLGRLLLGLERGDPRQCDHIDGDRLNYRRSNLRAVTHAQNGQNIMRRGGTSRYRGVSWSRRRKLWVAQGHTGGRTHFLGCFDSEHDAATAAREWRAEHLPFAVEVR